MSKSILLAALVGAIMTGCGGAPSTPSPTSAAIQTTPSPAETTAAASPAPAGDAEAIARGKTVYEGTCTACHGSDGKGIMNLGKALVGSPMLKLSDDELVAFITKGRDASDKDNTTGIAMPPKGGNPALTEKDLHDVVVYMRSLK